MPQPLATHPPAPSPLDDGAERRATVERLRELLRQRGVGAAVLPAAEVGAARPSEPRPGDAPLGDLRPGTLTAVSGPRSSGKTSLALSLLAEATRRGGLAAVVDGTGQIFPPALALLGAELERVLFLRTSPPPSEPGPETLPSPGRRGLLSVWAAEQVLRSGAFAVVVLLEPGPVDRAALRRLQLAAERSGARALLVSREPGPSAGLAAARLEADAIAPWEEGRRPLEERSAVASPPRRCRARLARRGDGAARAVDVEIPPPRVSGQGR
jgi:hypothetical protein